MTVTCGWPANMPAWRQSFKVPCYATLTTPMFPNNNLLLQSSEPLAMRIVTPFQKLVV